MICDALVIGGGPAGLMAAETLAKAGQKVIVADAKPSPARKFLMAGKSGLNLTKDQPLDDFVQSFSPQPMMEPMVRAFGPAQVHEFATDLEQPIFTGSSGRVFPTAMKASPLLRAWLARIDRYGVDLRLRWRWTGITDGAATFDTPDGPQSVQARTTVLALGGASWSRLGSDGHWKETLQNSGVRLAPFQPANMGFQVDWSPFMARHFGQPLKAVAVCGEKGEFVVSSKGVEGGGIYAAAAIVRDGAPLVIDLCPDLSMDQVVAKLQKPKGKASLSNHLRKTLKLDPVKLALLQEFHRPLPQTPAAIAKLVKSLRIIHNGPMPMDGAISTAGGVSWAALTPELMLTALPGVFCAGEMLDWEAPTGGYLITGCLATGQWAGQHAAAYATAVART
ncbi:MAG: TIGR03862 family flavoprotein [Planktomarina sp.]